MDYGISTGIHLRSIGNDLIPVQEEHEARLDRGISLDVWGNMDVMEKAMIVAVRRNRMAISNIQTDAEIRRAEKNMRKGNRKGR